MKKSVLIFLGAILLIASFYAGVKWNQFHYNDLCLDMGGGMRPGDYPMCIVDSSDTTSGFSSEQVTKRESFDDHKAHDDSAEYLKSGVDNATGWIKTVATIKEAEKMTDGTFAYLLVYKASQSTAKDLSGKPIHGDIEQNIFHAQQKMSVGDTVSLRYKKDEPLIFELLNHASSVHPTWDRNNDGRNDCEDDGTCDDSVDYSKPRDSVPGLDCSEHNSIVFDRSKGKWVDCYGICSTCTPENGFSKDGTKSSGIKEVKQR